jgi:AcrR family transcriptional regulator
MIGNLAHEARRKSGGDARRGTLPTASHAGRHGGDTRRATSGVVGNAPGVGIGTLYRHFPNRQALLEAVYRDQVNAHCVLGRELLATRSPAEALLLWLHSLLTYNLTMRGLKEALMAGEISPKISECKAQMHGVGGELLARAQEAGAVRRDIEITDLLRLVHSIALMVEPGAEGATRAERVFEVVLAGLKG